MLKVYLIFIGVMCAAAFCLYLADKIKARRGAWRISEKVLLLIGFFGGALGALAAMQIFRHKTRHTYFYVINVICLILQTALAVFIAIYI